MSASGRNLSIDTLFEQLAARHVPDFRFSGENETEFRQWKEDLLPRVIDLLGAAPECTDLNAELVVEWEEDGLVKQKILIDVEPGLSAYAYLFRQADAVGPLPAILCCHGHGMAAKEGVMGTDECSDGLARKEKAYGLQMAKAGFVTAALDWRGFGDRDDRNKPTHHDVTGGRDICNVHFLRALILGRTMLGDNVHDAGRLLDYICRQDFVDSDRIGVMGLSLGGTMTTWIALADERIKAADIICYSDRFADFGMRDVNFCGSQVAPNLYSLCDVPDLHGLIAPRPLLIEIGIHDSCFRIESAMSCYREVERIYEASGARDRLELDLFPDEHSWGGNKSVSFFRRALAEA